MGTIYGGGAVKIFMRWPEYITGSDVEILEMVSNVANCGHLTHIRVSDGSSAGVPDPQISIGTRLYCTDVQNEPCFL